MNNAKNRAITYSLLAHIRNKGSLTGGPIQMFIPLIKRVLSKMNEEGVFNGKSIIEIKKKAEELYSIDIPIPALRSIFKMLADELNSESAEVFILNNDDSFQILNYTFTEFEEDIRSFTIEVENIEKLYKDFCFSYEGKQPKAESIIEFIEKNKYSLSKYLAHKNNDNNSVSSIEAQFVNYFKRIPSVYNIIRRIYLGSILSTFIEYETKDVKINVELLLDTNFILGYFDLNTEESYSTCRKIIDIAKKQDYEISVLSDTIIEVKNLIKAKSENFDSSFIEKRIYPEDILNACERRQLNKADLDRVADKIEMEIKCSGFEIQDASKYKAMAMNSKYYHHIKGKRNSEFAAIHDAIAVTYVREKRKHNIRDFEDVNCWFLNNSFNRDRYDFNNPQKENQSSNQYQPETIKADDFLNILWLSSPAVDRNINYKEVADIGLTSLISLSLSESLPKMSVIKELNDNIEKYSKDGSITDSDIVKLSTRIATKQLKDLDSLNKIAKTDSKKFLKRINEEARKQDEIDEERNKNIEKTLKDIKLSMSDNLEEIKREYAKKTENMVDKISKLENRTDGKDRKISDLEKKLIDEKASRIEIENKNRLEKREVYIKGKLRKWQDRATIEVILEILFFLILMICLLYFNRMDFNDFVDFIISLSKLTVVTWLLSLVWFVFTSISIRKWFDRTQNPLAIESFKRQIDIPNELTEIKD